MIFHTSKRAGHAKIHTVPDSPLNVSGSVIRRLRAKHGWTQPELVAACHFAGWEVSRDIIARIEGGTKLVRDSELAVLAAVFGVKPTDLIAERFAQAVEKVKKAKQMQSEALGEK